MGRSARRTTRVPLGGQKLPPHFGPPPPTKARPSSSFLPQKSRRGLPASHLRRDHHNPWCTGVSSCTVQHICDVSHFCTHTGAETPVRATSTVHTARTPRTPRTHTPHTHPHPRAQHSALVAEVGGRCGASTRHFIILFTIVFLILFLIYYLFLFVFLLHALRYAKSHSNKGRTVGEGPDSTKVRGGVLWDSGADFRAIVRILPMAKKTPKKGPPDPPKRVPRTPQKGPPKGSPRKSLRQRGRAVGGRIWVDLGLVRQYIYTTGAEGGWGRACGGVGEGPPGTPKPPKP